MKKLIRLIKKNPNVYTHLKSVCFSFTRTRVRFRVLAGDIKSSVFYFLTLGFKRCYFGPYTGEFGHLLAHNLPFVAYLYSKGVKVEFCGMDIHRPFFVDQNGKEIVSSYLPLRDFFGESVPDCNKAVEPKDVAQITKVFVEKAKRSVYPYWNNSNSEYYFHSFRWWLLKKAYMTTFDLSKIYKTKDENAVVIFPRKFN